MPDIFSSSHFYLVGIKGVAMTGMMVLLSDLGKHVTGCDVAEEFVTQKTLDKYQIKIDAGFEHEIPDGIDCVIYTSAHNGKYNPIVQQAESKNIPTCSHAEALGLLTKNKKTIAVCGVGGKSTVSAMISWIFEKQNIPISYSVGVGAIPGLDNPSKYDEDSEYFVVEADEYVTDPSALKNNESITPRFSYLFPHITVLTNLSFDHPDVYTDFEDTKQHFQAFFNQIDHQGSLILNSQAQKHDLSTSAKITLTFGKENADITFEFNPSEQKPGKTVAQISERLTGNLDTQHTLQLQIPGEYNISNAIAAIAAAHQAGVSVEQSIAALSTFASTQRRFEFKQKKNNLILYDDYAHHPQEIRSAIKALNSWYPDTKKIIAFQPHTFSRTKELLHEFTHAFRDAEEVLLLDIFASARESVDSSISSDILCDKIRELYPKLKISNIGGVANLKNYIAQLDDSVNRVLLTLGAGDIYKVHDMM